MRGPPSFRTRLVATLITIVTITVVGLGTGAYLFVARSLRSQLVAESVERTNFSLAVLATEWLDADPTRLEYEAGPLDEALRLRGDLELYIDFGDGDPYLSKPAFVSTPALVSPSLAGVLAAGHIARQWVSVEDVPYLLAAGRRGSKGPDFYFYYPAQDLETSLRTLRQALIAGGIVLMLAGALAGNWIARRVLLPVRQASEAALHVAGGDLTVRLETGTDDEFGAWARAFNRMAASLQQTVEQLEAAQRRERRFVADVSHELRTPLTGLVQEAALISQHLEKMPADDRRVGELLVADVARVRKLVDDLLEISRLDAGAQTTTLEMVDAGEFVAAAARARLSGAVVLVPAGPVEARLDRRRLERILGNLLDNARTHAGGRDVEVTVRRTALQLVVEVADRGPGVDPTELERIFDRFSKGDRARSGGGTGLGLAIAREHARQLGGEVTARLRAGGGMVFEVQLPV